MTFLESSDSILSAAKALQHKPHVLLVDDDPKLRKLIAEYLGLEGFLVLEAESAAAAAALLPTFAFDIAILDILMPKTSGLEWAVELKATPKLPFIFLTALHEAENRIAGLELGADDYLAKPFEPRELLLRLRRILERSQTPSNPDSDTQKPSKPKTTVAFGVWSFDTETRRLYRSSDEIPLTEMERHVLGLLAKHPDSLVLRDTFLEAAPEAIEERTVDVQITRLRKKLEDNPRFPRYLQTLRGKGYVLRTR